MPDAKTIWLFREHLTQTNKGKEAIDNLFAQLHKHLQMSGYLAAPHKTFRGGQIVDATLVSASRQRNTDEKKEAKKHVG